MSIPRSLEGRRIHIAGSASPERDRKHRAHAHAVVRMLVHAALAEGAGIVVGAGREPQAKGAPADDPALHFDWTAIEEAGACIRAGECRWPVLRGPPVIVATSGKAESEIPPERIPLWRELLDGRHIKVEFILPGARSAALLRERQAEHGDCIVLLGGGTGVEHLAELYRSRRRSVVPLHFPLGASRGDGMGGAERLFLEARTNPEDFLQTAIDDRATVTGQLAGLASLGIAAPPSDVAARILDLLRMLSPPTAFYVRLLNKDEEDFAEVEAFFRKVIDPFVDGIKFERFEMGKDKAKQAFMNVEIFERLHFASLAIVDMTGLRPSCMIELGYALARGMPVLVTAREGTRLPFDPDKIPCHFWRPAELGVAGQGALRDFWAMNRDRPRLVR